MLDALFFLKSVLLGIGLAVDSFVVAMANGMTDGRSRIRAVVTAAMLAVFQFAAVMIGWSVAHVAYIHFEWLKTVLSFSAAVVFLFFGIKSLAYPKKDGAEQNNIVATGIAAVLVQCVATSADALTVGLTIEEYGAASAVICAAVISVVTFGMYLFGHAAGKKFGMRYERIASVVGGIAFISIAVEIIITTLI